MINIILIPLMASIFLAVNMGGSGVAAAFSSSYGANLIRKDLIPVLFGIFVLFGAVLSGKEVTKTIGSNIIHESYFTMSITTIMMFSIGLSILIANILNVPQSTSQSTVFALVGIGVCLGNINTKKCFLKLYLHGFTYQ